MPRTLGFSDGSSMSVDRTREAGKRTLGFSDGSSIEVDRSPTIQNDEAGNSRPLLGKLIGGAAVAYSLRDLNSKQGESKVVNVRRHTDNKEKVFTANRISTVPDWVQGALDDTLPLDVSNDTATAYSLRKVKKSYNGPLVRIRRTMDNCEVDVYPDSDGKVSEKSRIVNLDGRVSTFEAQDKLNTSAKTLGEFIKPVGENLIIDNVTNVVGSSTNSISHYNTLFDQRVGGKDCFYLSAQGSTRDSSGGVPYHKYNQHYTAIRAMSPNTKKVEGENLIVKYEYYVPSITPTTPNGQVGVTNTCRGLLAQTPYSPQTVTPSSTVARDIQLDTWHEGQTEIHNGIASNDTIFNGIRLRLAFKYTGNLSGSGNVYYDTNRQNDDEFNVDGHGCYIRNIRVYSDTCDARVVTWYDQGSENNNATAVTHDNQPNLAANGVLLSDGVSFNGALNKLTTENNFVLSDTDDLSISSVLTPHTTDSVGTLLSQEGTGGKVLLTLRIQKYISSYLGGGGGVSLVQYDADKELLLSALYDDSANTVKGYTNGTIGVNNTSVTSTACTGALSIGVSRSNNEYLNASVKEFIIYKSDQALNRVAIENNINNHYGLYNNKNELDGDWVSNASSGFTANGKDGFTITASANQIQSIKLKTPMTTIGSRYIYVSFYADDPDGLLHSAQMRVTPTGLSGSDFTINNGFNEIRLVSSTNYAWQYLTIKANTSSAKTATISDIRISRQLGDATIETWYDQSGNDRHASQDEGQAQPYIVRYGGQIKIGNKPAIDQRNRSTASPSKAGLGVFDYKPTKVEGALTEYSFFGHYEAFSSDFSGTSSGVLFSAGGPAGNSSYGGLSVTNTSGTRLIVNNTDGNNVGGGTATSASVIVRASTSNQTAYSSIWGNYLISAFFKDGVSLTARANGVESSDVEANAPIPHASANNSNAGHVRLLAEWTFKQTSPWRSPVSELIFFEKDLRDDALAIEANINNYYQIY